MADTELVKLNLAAIQMGSLMDRVDESLDRISQDIVERPDIKRPRTVTLTITVKPDDKAAEGFPNLPEIDWKVDWKVPGSQGMVTRGFIEDGVLKVNKHDPNAAQMTIHDNVKPIRKEGE